MPTIENFDVNKTEGILHWNFLSQQVSVAVKNIDQALADDVHKVIIVLSDADKLPKSLSVFSGDGEELFRITSSSELQFYYLSEHPELGVSVVCVFPDPVDGWRDWHFGIDFQKKELFRHCPAY
jgi:hypothetical protein